jgi:carboxypeptidase family protein
LWAAHTVGAAGATSAQAAVRYYQVKVTGGNVEANASRAFTFSPDATVHRFMPSVAVDSAGNMAIGYSATSTTLNPAIRYAGRLAADAANSITQTETSLIEGTGAQSGTCGSTCTRWGDYSAMSLDPDGCTFWYTNMYYQTTGLAFNTRIGAFSLPGCTMIGPGAIQGTVTAAVGDTPIQGVSVALGSRTTTTDVNGNYTLTGLSAGTYPGITASYPGYSSSTATAIVVTDGGTTTQNFALTVAPTSGCLTDTTQADFFAGVPTNCDLTGSPGNITLVNAASIDQNNTAVKSNGFGFSSTTWAGQTFTPAVTGQLTRVDIDFFCSGCSGTTPNLTVSIRATTGARLDYNGCCYDHHYHGVNNVGFAATTGVADWLGFTSVGLIGVVIVGVRRRNRMKALIFAAVSLIVLLMATGCGGRSEQTPVPVPGTPSGISTVTVPGSTGGFTHSTTFTLTVN